ncbi:thioesterase [Marinicauda pacifica]|uniref:Thioesterase n=1 Tax=Marinicauda pacifica TaxID=1133559 RepID=A0A4S2H891_9PROT|nr:thioesterase family protein [Marinicauda pacifica]TGY91883.1 thioesterase [Marinicauda pacifica]GGE49998.1 thioesterase [Marinicauda pacifica]
MHELWRGNANAWECDELGHLNVRHYITKAMQGIGTLSDLIGMRRAFGGDASATLIARTMHIRFFAESRPGAPLHIQGGVLDVRPDGLDAVLMMYHSATARLAASFVISLDHAAPRSGQPFTWPDRMQSRLDQLLVRLPDEAGPRGIEPAEPASDLSLQRADALDLAWAGRGRFLPEDADMFGWMRAECAMGKVSDSVIHFKEGFPEQWASHAGNGPARRASALLEVRIAIRNYARPGDGFVIRSGLTGVGEKVRNLVHWVLDPVTGRPWWSVEGVACIMDLDARELVPTEADTLASLRDQVREELKL